jgi:hypothetical protein
MIILIPLFAVNAIFNLRYEWGGISTIARVYIMVLSFYVVFIFSQIEADDYKDDYRNRYGWKGKYYLFFTLRLFPFIFIYLLTVVFVIINYLNKSNWPIEPVYRLLDGRFSNTVIYPLLLFVVLRLERRPRVSIPLFIIFSIIYYVADHELYALLEPGPGVSIIKLSKYFIFIFILVYGYSKKRWRLFESLIFSFFGGIISFSIVTSFIIMSFFISSPGSSTQFITGGILFKSGFIFPINKLKHSIPYYGSPRDTQNFIEYVDKYKLDTGFSESEWGKIILKNKIENNEYIFRHLNQKNITLEFEMLKKYSAVQFLIFTPTSIELTHFPRHLGLYYKDHKTDFYELYRSGNEPVKIMILKSLAYADDVYAVKFLTDKLTSVERSRSETAYDSLKSITGEDPASVLKKEKYDLDVVLFFRDYALKMKE